MAYSVSKIKWRKPKTYRNDVIATAKATGCVLQFWNSLLVGDELTILSIVDNDEYNHLIDAIYDTSNVEEWNDFRFNYRGLRRLPELWFYIKLATVTLQKIMVLIFFRVLGSFFERYWVQRIVMQTAVILKGAAQS